MMNETSRPDKPVMIYRKTETKSGNPLVIDFDASDFEYAE